MLRLLLLLATLTFLFACELSPSKPEIGATDLEGHWDVTKATRNGRPTESLMGAFFAFSPENNEISTNLLGDTVTVPYTLSGDTIYQQMNTPIVYIIQELEGSVMVVKTSLRNTPFEFFLEKKDPVIQ